MSSGFGNPDLTPRPGPWDGDSDEEDMKRLQNPGPGGVNISRYAIDKGYTIDTGSRVYKSGAECNEISGLNAKMIRTLTASEIERLVPSQNCLANLILQYVTTKEEAEKVLGYLLKKFPNSDSDELIEYRAQRGQISRSVSDTSTVSQSSVDERRELLANAREQQKARDAQNDSPEQGVLQYSNTGNTFANAGRGYTLGE